MSKDFISWNEIYSLGIEKIDNQHKKLIEIINKLFDSFSEGKAEDIIPEIIKELTEYTQYHFKTEEELFEKYNYPEKESHTGRHNEFINNVKDWKEKLNNNNKELPYELMEYLKKWMLQHILKEDKDYGKFFKEKNITV